MSNPFQFLGGLVGAGIGFLVGGPGGAAWGFQIGLGVASAINPGPAIKGPRLNDMPTTVAERGAPVFQVFGTETVMGTIIWEGPRSEHVKTKKKGGFLGIGGQKIKTYSYTKSCAVGLCSYISDQATILRIWENGELVYDIRADVDGEDASTKAARLAASAKFAENMTIYSGADDQDVDPTMEAVEGVGNVHAYRGLMYAVFEERVLRDDQGSTLPGQWEFEIGERVQNSEVLMLTNGGGIYPSTDGGATFSTTARGHVGLSASGGQCWMCYSPELDVMVASTSAYAPRYSLDRGATWADCVNPGGWSGTHWRPGSKIEWHPVLGMFVMFYERFSQSSEMLPVTAVSTDGVNWTNSPNHITSNGANNSGDTGMYGAPDVAWLTETSVAASYHTGIAGGIFVGGPTTFTRIAEHNVEHPESAKMGMVNPNTGALVIAAGSGGGRRLTNILTNTDNWANLPAITNGGVRAVWCDALGLWVMGGSFDYPRWSADDGLTWTVGTGVNSGALGAGTFSTTWCPTTGAAFVCGVSSGTYYAKRSLDGKVWVNCNPFHPVSGAQPQMVVELSWYEIGEPVTAALPDIITGLLTRDGQYAVSDFDVTDLTGIEFLGYRRGQGDLGGDMDLLRKIGLFDIVEADTKLFFVRRGAASVATINASDLGAFDPNDGQGLPPPDVTTSMLKETELPARVTVKYRSPTREYENATQASPYRLVTDARSEQTVEIAASLSDDHAAQLADILLRNAWAERVRYETQLDSAFAYLRASNPILLPVDGRNRRCRIVSADDADLLLRKLTLVADDDGAYVSTAVGVAPPSPPPLTGVSDTLAVLLDLPKLNDADENIGFYLALYPERPASAWPGGELYSAYFGTEEIVGFTGSSASVGTVDSPAGAGITTTWDTANTIDVIVPSTVSLASKTDVELISDFTANLFAVGVHGRWEVAQFLDAELIATDSGTGDKTYRLSNLLRGRRGTEWAVGTGMADDTFVLLDDAITRIPLSISLLNVSVDYRPITAGDDYSSGSDQTFASAGMALKPFSPVDIVGEWTGGDVTITWKRRTRYIGDVPDAGGDVELGEESESYDVELYVSSVLVDSGTVTSASFDSSAGTEGVTEVRIYQNSALVGRGIVGVATV